MARLAAIDIGSNAIRLRIVDVDPPGTGPASPLPGAGAPLSNGNGAAVPAAPGDDGANGSGVPSSGRSSERARFPGFREVLAERASVRLGHDVFTKGELEPSVIASACEALRKFREAMDAAKVDRYRAVATSAAREAKNGDLLVERAEREAGVYVEVIEGIEEARLVQLAVTERLSLADKTALLIDIGGGSTELTLLVKGQAVFARSLPIGTVRLIEAFLESGGPVGDRQRKLLDEYIERVTAEPLRELSRLLGGAPELVIGTGGNIETLADLCPAPAVPEFRSIDVAAMRRLLQELCARTVDERITSYALRPDRADTIVPAAAVLSWIANGLEVSAIGAPGVGLKEGVLYDLAFQHYLPHDVRGATAAVTDACLRLGRRYHFDEAHGALVARFATRLFDDLASRHRMTPRDRVLLVAAALLHDIGDFVRYEGHHKHSHYIITQSDLMGLSPEERAIVANVARYHRKSVPSLEHENFRALSREARGKVKAMAAILRVADALDREHRGKITGMSAQIDGSTLVLEVQGNEDRSLEEWTVSAKSGLLREVFGLDTRVVEAPPPANGAPAAPPPSAARPGPPTRDGAAA